MSLRRWFLLVTLLALGAAAAAPVRADEGAAASASASVAPAKKKKKAKKKPYDYEQSKYKAYKVLVAGDAHSYRFDERGNPIPAGGKKKALSKKKKKAEDEGASCDAGEASEACQDDMAGGQSSASADAGE